MKCDFCKARGPDDTGLAYWRGWDWFTGFRERTFYACPSCRKAKSVEIAFVLEKSRVPPARNEIGVDSK